MFDGALFMLRTLFCSLCLLIPSMAMGEDHHIWVLLADGFNRQEHYGSVGPLLAAGYHISIISPGGATVRLNRSGEIDGRGRDVPAHASLAEAVQQGHEGVIGLLIPGGYSPGNLEQHDDALAIVDSFVEARKPIAAICHGPRLLMRGGHLQGRVWTGLWTLADELPNNWIEHQRGAYLDRGVIRDGALLTGRYPNDVADFARAAIQQFARHGGPALPHTIGTYVIAAPGWSDHQRWWMEISLRTLGHQAHVINNPERWDADRAQDALVLQLPQGQEQDRGDWSDIDLPEIDPRLSQYQSVEALLPILGGLAGESGSARAREGERRTVPTAALALREGFDDAVAVTLLSQLRALGFEVIIIAPQQGWLRGLNGLPLEASADYETANLAEQALIVLPGGHYPEYRENARQGEQADWLAQQDERDQRRQAWLQQQWENGARFVAVGSDSWLLTRNNKAFSGLQVSSSSQLRWSFHGDGARFSNDTVLQSHDRLLTARGFDALPECIPLLPTP